MPDHLQDELLRRPIAPTETLPAAWLEAFLSGAEDLASGVYNHPRETLGGFVEGAKGPAKRVASRLGENAVGLAKTALTPPTDTAAEMGKNLAFTSPSDYPAEGVKMLTGVDPREDFPEMSADALTGALLARGLSGGSGRGSGSNGRPNTPPVHNVPAELEGFRPSGHEFNEPALRPALPPEELAKLKELTSPAGARNRGSYDPPHDGSLPKHKEVIPPFREKSGIALDVLEDMKHSVPPPEGVNITPEQWRKFKTNPSQAIMDDPIFATLASQHHEQYDKLWHQRHNGSMLSEFASKNDNRLPNNIYSSEQGEEPRSLLFLEDDPAKFVGHLRSFDNVDALHTGKYAPHRTPGMIESMVQDLADHFTQPQYDPAVQDAWEAIPDSAPSMSKEQLKKATEFLRQKMRDHQQ